MRTTSILAIVICLIVVVGVSLYILTQSNTQKNPPSTSTITTTQAEENKDIQNSNDDVSAIYETLDNI